MKRRSTRKPRGRVVDELFRNVYAESAGELELLAFACTEAYPDASPAEKLQIDILVHARAWIKRSADFIRVRRRINAASRTLHQALDELQRLRAARKTLPPKPHARRRQPKPGRQATDPWEGRACRWIT